MKACPCGTGLELEVCCGPVLAGRPAATAETLMRSRYTAFVVGAFDHVERTHAPEVRDEFNRLDAERLFDEAKWLGLEITRVIAGGTEDQTGQVEFVVRYSKQGKPYLQHELATFRRENGEWLYQSGELNPKSPPRHVEKIGRNDPCSCGSGKKYKKCCG